MPSLALKFILSPKNMIFRHYSIKSSKSQYRRINSQPLQHRMVKLLPSKKVDSILKLTSLK